MNSKTKSSTATYMGRVNSDIFRILTLALQKSSDEKFSNIHILRVETASDLGTARVYVNEGAKELEVAGSFFRNEVAQNLKIRRVPALRFIVDDGEKNTARVEELLKKIELSKSK